MTLIKTALVEDDPVWQTYIGEYIGEYIEEQPDMFLVGRATNRQEANQLMKLAPCDVVIMDIMLTDGEWDGIDTTLDLLMERDVKVIMLTSLVEDEVIYDSFTAGAVNYITKENYEDIPGAVRQAYENRVSIHPDAAMPLSREFAAMRNKAVANVLTPSEKRVLKMMVGGHTQSSIERKLHVTRSTVKKHINKILRKLRVKSSKEAVEEVNKRKLFKDN